MDNRIDRRYLIIGAELLLLGGISLTGMYNFLLFHTLVELFSIVVAYSIFMVGWHSFHRDDYFLLLGIAYGAVATLDLLHTMSYKGIGIFPGGADRPTQLWIAARYLESVSLLLAPLLYGRRLRSDLVGAGYAAITLLLIGSIFWWDIFPTCYIEGVGLTPFKTVSEYLISLILLAAMAAMIQKRTLFASPTLRLLLLSIAATIGAELAFTFYVSVYGLSNQIGHLLKLVSFYLIYKAIVETGLKRPHTLLFRQLTEVNRQLQSEISERERIERVLRQSEERFRRIFEDNPVGIAIVSTESQRILQANRRMAEILGYTQAELLELTVMDITHPADMEVEREDINRIIREEAPLYSMEKRYIKKSGALCWVQVTAMTMPGREAEGLLGVGMVEDITDRKEMEAALRQSQALLLEAEKMARLGSWEWDIATGIITCSEGWQRIHGVERERFPIEELFPIAHPDDMDRVQAAWQDALSGKRPYDIEHRIIRQDTGEERTVQAYGRVVWDEAGQPIRMYGTAQDITGRKEMEAALRRSEEQFRNIVNALPQLVAYVDKDLVYRFVNRRYEQMFQVEAAEVIGQYMPAFIGPKAFAEARSPVERALAGEPVRYETYFEYSPDNRRYIDGQLIPDTGPAGEMRGYYAVLTDITRYKAAEEAIRRSEQTLRRRNRDLALLNRAGQAFNAALEPDQVFDMVLETMRDMWGALDSSIWLVEPFPPPARGKAALVCHYLSPSQNADIRGWRLALDQGVAGWVVQQQQSALVADTRLDPRHDKGVDEHTGQEVRSILAAPLRSEAAVLGVLELVDHRPDRFEADDLQTFESLAATAAIAVRNARLYAQVQRDAETKALLLHEVNHRVKNNLDAIIGLLYLERRFAPPETRPYLQPIIADLSHRITGLAQVHRLLSASEWSPLLLSELAEQIIRTALQTMPVGREATVEVSPSPIRVGPGQAHHLALVISELTANTLKYAVPEQEQTHIRVEISGQGDTVTLIYRNDGPGYPAEVLRLERHNAGLEIVQKIVRKNLGGQLTLRNEGGPVTIIQFQNSGHSSPDRYAVDQIHRD